jgi:hypothetical protein
MNDDDVTACRLHFTNPFSVVQIIDTTRPASVLGRHVFYNQSYFDGGKEGIDPLPLPLVGEPWFIPNEDDADAIDPNKHPLRAGDGMAGFANWTDYIKGINGLIYDFAFSNRDPVPADFTFYNIGKDGTIPPGPDTTIAPAEFLVQDLGIVKRAILTFPNGSLTNTWLQVTIGTGFGLPAPETHWWGNAVGDGGGNTLPSITVSPSDEALCRMGPHTVFNRATVDVPYDYNKDSIVGPSDEAICRPPNQTTVFDCVKAITR